MSDSLGDLLSAAEAGDLDRLCAALLAGADMNGQAELAHEGPVNGVIKVMGGKTALHLAVERGHPAIAQELIRVGADPNPFSQGTVFITAETPLHIAARCGDLTLVRLLLAGGARADLRQLDRHDVPGRFAVQLAVEKGHRDVVLLLLKPRDKSSRIAASAALYEATDKGLESMARLLLEHGADVNRPFRKMRSWPLPAACFHGYAAIAKLFIEAGADIHFVNKKKNTLMHEVVEGARLAPEHNRGAEIPRDHAATAAILIASGAPANAVNEKNQTPLQRANNLLSLAPRLKGVIDLLETTAK